MKKSFKRIFLLVLIVVLLLSTLSIRIMLFVNKPKVIFPKDRDTIAMPFWLNKKGQICTKMQIENDTITFIIDTGADKTCLPSKYENLNGVHKKDMDKSSWMATDILGVKKIVPTVKIDRMKWNGIVFRNFRYGVDKSTHEGLLGGDLLKNFCIKFDNERQIIILSPKSENIQRKGTLIPFAYDNNKILVPGILSISPSMSSNMIKNDTSRFIFDTGYDEELRLNKKSYDSLKIVPHNETKWIMPITSFHFRQGTFVNDSTQTYSLIDFKFGSKEYKNAIICSDNSQGKSNYIGRVFMNRFRSFTIDYPNKVLYLDLPDDNEDLKMYFSGKSIENITSGHAIMIFSRLNSLGVEFSNDSTNGFIVSAVLKRLKDNISIGDTIVGIDNTLFSKAVYDEFKKFKRDLKLIENKAEQNTHIGNVFGSHNSVTFHFWKKGKMKSISTNRDTFLTHPPVTCYSFGTNASSSMYFALSAINYANKKINQHIMWNTLSGQKIDFVYYNSGKEIKISNIAK